MYPLSQILPGLSGLVVSLICGRQEPVSDINESSGVSVWRDLGRQAQTPDIMTFVRNRLLTSWHSSGTRYWQSQYHQDLAPDMRRFLHINICKLTLSSASCSWWYCIYDIIRHNYQNLSPDTSWYCLNRQSVAPDKKTSHQDHAPDSYYSLRITFLTKTRSSVSYSWPCSYHTSSSGMNSW